MNKEMIVSSNDHETMVAILEDDQVVELFIERERNRGVVGNIYKGRVSKVLPGMQSAFVDLGLERDGFLYVTDVVSTTDQFDQLEASDGEAPVAADVVQPSVEVPGDAAAELAGELPHDDDPGHDHGDVAGLIEEPGDEGDPESERAPEPVPEPIRAAIPVAAAVPVTPVRTKPEKPADRPSGEPTIDQLLKEGQEVVVQVVKEPLGTKGARITCHASIPGRFLVFMPTVDHVGVSRKIESRDERARLRGIVRQFREQHNFTGGVIIRTAASGRPEADILGDLNDFHQIWQEIRHKLEATRAPSAVYREQSLVAKLLRDLLTEEYQTIRIDSLAEYRKVQQLVERMMPTLLPRVKLYTKDYPIFEEYGVRNEIDKALRSKVWLKSGGYIVINQTEALVAIDVNTGRYVGKKTGRLEDTIVKTNLEAAREIVRQLRLRDLGGIIVLDFIDMEERKNRLKVFGDLEQALRRDRSPSKAIQVSEFGLIIVTRKRVKQSLERLLTDPCPYCSGTGTVKSTATICFDILSELRKVTSELNGHGVLLRVNPEIAKSLQGEEQSVLRDLERTVGRRIHIKADATLHHEQFDVMAV
ncbi:MAG: ribonuclease E/G [Vicinamibacteria bacterium]|jgi:ribonuclease G